VSDFHFSYPSVMESEERMMDDIYAVLRENNITGRLRYRFLLTVSEAFTNALVHGNEYDPEKEIKIHLIINENQLCADITDQGRGGLKKVKDKKPNTLLSTGGRGIDLMKNYSNRVKFIEENKGGLTVSISIDKHEKKQTSCI